MITICEKSECTGCFACLHTCTLGAISTEKDEKGFLYPKIDSDKCIECGRCQKVCPSLNKPKAEVFEKKVYACWSNDASLRETSTSGGLFAEMAKTVLNAGGKVYGVTFDDSMTVCHIGVDNTEQLYRLQGSKYVQSELRDTYVSIKSDLERNTTVLFSGTPCQCAGLKNFLGREYDGLYTCDLVCHGVPSPAFFDDYKKFMSEKYKSKIKNIYFRDKITGWKISSMRIEFENGKQYHKDVYRDKYLRAFLDDYIGRACCAQCKYANTERISDITIADFWGFYNSHDFVDDDKGISEAIINTNKGMRLFDSCSNKLKYTEKSLKEAVEGNPCLSRSFKPHKDTDVFWRDYKQFGYKYVVKKYVKIAESERLGYKIRHIDKDKIKHLPNRILMSVFGRERYEKLKRKLKK